MDRPEGYASVTLYTIERAIVLGRLRSRFDILSDPDDSTRRALARYLARGSWPPPPRDTCILAREFLVNGDTVLESDVLDGRWKARPGGLVALDVNYSSTPEAAVLRHAECARDAIARARRRLDVDRRNLQAQAHEPSTRRAVAERLRSAWGITSPPRPVPDERITTGPSTPTAVTLFVLESDASSLGYRIAGVEFEEHGTRLFYRDRSGRRAYHKKSTVLGRTYFLTPADAIEGFVDFGHALVAHSILSARKTFSEIVRWVHELEKCEAGPGAFLVGA